MISPPTTPNPPPSDRDGTARASASPLVVAGVLAISGIVAVNVVALIHFIRHGLIHVSRYNTVWLPQAVSRFPDALSIGLGVGMLIAVWIVALRRGSSVGGLGRRLAWGIPAVAPLLLTIADFDPPWIGFALVMLVTLMLAWTLAGAVTPVQPALATVLDPPRLHREPGLWVIVVLSLGFAVFHALAQWTLFQQLQYGSPDIGYYAEMLGNVLRGRGLTCEAFGHFFGEHFSPGLYLLVPLYALHPHIETLMVGGAVALCCGAWPVYGLARARGLSASLATGLACGYLLFPSTSRCIYGASYGFHEIHLAVPCMLWSFYALERRRPWSAVLWILLAVSMKENVAVVYAAVGLCRFLGDRRERWGLALLAGGLLYFGLVLTVIVPHFNADDAYSKLYLYRGLGESPGAIATTLITAPLTALQRLARPAVLGFALTLVIPLAGLPLRRTIVLAAVPTWLFLGLMDQTAFCSVRFWQQSSILAILWVATIEAVSATPRHSARVRRVTALVGCAAITHFAYGYSPFSRVAGLQPPPSGQTRELLADLDRLVPRDATVQATPRLAAHFLDRDRVYPMHRAPEPPADWLIVDLGDTFAGAAATDAARQRLQRELDEGRYRLAYRDATVVVLQRLPVTPDP